MLRSKTWFSLPCILCRVLFGCFARFLHLNPNLVDMASSSKQCQLLYLSCFLSLLAWSNNFQTKLSFQSENLIKSFSAQLLQYFWARQAFLTAKRKKAYNIPCDQYIILQTFLYAVWPQCHFAINVQSTKPCSKDAVDMWLL